jgi:hypothetical protein
MPPGIIINSTLVELSAEDGLIPPGISVFRVDYVMAQPTSGGI